ncbi:MAG: FAD-dependent oxidoreductase [Veillonellaceae bacterium]|nr:FAD-dependent oxidoreductase [Veillonellaceae bacterium]
MKYRNLFQPIQIGAVELRNRISMPAINHSYSEDGQVNQRLIAYYAARGKGGAGLIIVGGCSVHEWGRSFRNLGIYNDSFLPGLQKLTEAVRASGAKVFAQLYHAGGYAKSAEIGAQAVAPSTFSCRYTHETARQMEEDDFAAIRKCFVQAALRAKQAGFDGVELIGSAGYLIAEFLSPYTNRRNDQYGGCLENRSRFLLEIIGDIQQVAGCDYPIIVRLSGNDFVAGGNDNLEAAAVAKLLEAAGVAAIDVTGGWHETVIPQVTGEVPGGGYAYLAAGIKQAVGIPVIASNRINNPADAERILTMGLADMVNMGRALLADPELPNKVREGNEKEVRRCIACGQGCYDRRFSGQAVECMINYRAGREFEWRNPPVGHPKRILVIGGGVAGMEFAIQAAARGHKVTLWEKSSRLGGQLHYAAKAVGKRDFSYLLEYQTYMLDKYPVNVELVQEANVDTIRKFSPDALVIATGSAPIPAPFAITAAGCEVVQANEVLAGESIPGRRVVVVGGGAVGCETAVLLADQGTISAEQTKFLMRHRAETDDVIHALLAKGAREITIVEMAKDIGRDIGLSTRWGVKKHMKQLGIRCLSERKVLAITESGVVVQNPAGEEEVLAADTVVLAIGSRSRNELGQALAGMVPEVFVIGDAAAPGKISRCIGDAVELALKI